MARPRKGGTRVERDSMGEMRVPADAYYGAQTARAVEKFSHFRAPFRTAFHPRPRPRQALGRGHQRFSRIARPAVGDAIMRAADEVVSGTHDDEFVVDVFQTGSGTSTNMNANEVIANRAVELLGGKRGDNGPLHPNDHVNMGQSTNDVFPTAIHVAALEAIRVGASAALPRWRPRSRRARLRLGRKAGRTHLQDAVPMTLGQEFSGYAP
jgi:fumarate hydratase class II